MKTSKPHSTIKFHGLFFTSLLAVILAVLFWKSFLPGYVHFNNDGPLGQQNAEWQRPSAGFTGIWYDINDLGSNAGAAQPSLITLIRWGLGPVGTAKFFAPIALFILGLGAWTFFRQLKLSPLAAALGALAATLNSTFFATACWGVASQQIAIGMDFFALALAVSNTPETPFLIRWARLALAGLAVGVNVMEAADIGAIFSMFIAAFVFFNTLNEAGAPILGRIARGLGRVAMIAAFAGFIAAQAIVSVVGSYVVGIAGTGQETAAKAQHWDFATQWSLPKTETLGLIVPGLFGYKMDTPLDMMAQFQDAYRGGLYWGGVGRDPNTDRFLDNTFQPGDEVTLDINTPDHPNQKVALKIGPDGNLNPPLLGQIKVAGLSGLELKESVDQSYASQGIQASVELPGGFMRFVGGGNYAGILVALVALWAMAQSFRRQNSPFPDAQKRMIWFWAVVLAVSLPLAWGRFAPLSKTSDSMMFYALLYKLPYFSTIRNPVKFLLILSWAAVILFAYGIHALNRRHLDPAAMKSRGLAAQLKNWWAKAGGFDRKWTFACGGILAASVLAWLVYSAQKPGLIHYLQEVGFPGADPSHENSAAAIAAFSIAQAGWFLFLFAAAAALVILIIAGYFAGPRAKIGALLLGAFLVFDLGRADLPYIIHWDYPQKYDIDPANPANSSNPIINFLRDKPYEHRVANLPFNVTQHLPLYDDWYGDLYRIAWAQHHFPYYNIQSLDIIQMARMPSDLMAYEAALEPHSADTEYLLARHWELTNTRYLLGAAGYLDVLNEQLDPGHHRFRIVQRFDIVSKPGIEQLTQLTEMTAAPGNNGALALFDFTGALPRARLYSNWQIRTNDPAALQPWLDEMRPFLAAERFSAITNLNTTDQSTLKTLTDENFNPAKTVLLSAPLPVKPAASATNVENSGTVEFKSYSPKDIVFAAQAAAPSVLLLNDMFDPNWHVSVDGKPAELLRCNFIMRGVYLTPGVHTVEFQFRLANKPLYITLAAIGVGILLCGFLFAAGRRALPRRV